MLELTSHSPDETQRIGAALGACAQPGDVLLLCGDLGAGKTCLTQGIAKGLDVDGYVRSPTFVLVTIHQGRLPLYHIDIYRLDHVAEVLDLGLEEYLAGDGVSVIEWADKAPEAFPEDCLRVTLDTLGEDSRLLRLHPNRRPLRGACAAAPRPAGGRRRGTAPVDMELAIDTSTRYAGVCLSQEGRVLVSRSWYSRQNHTVELLPAVQELLKEAGAIARDLECVFVAIGPGGFSALRVGLSTAKGLCTGLNIPLVALNTLDVEAEPYRDHELPACALLDMGRGEAAARLLRATQRRLAEGDRGAHRRARRHLRGPAATRALLRRGRGHVRRGAHGAAGRSGRAGRPVPAHALARHAGRDGQRPAPAR